MTRRSAGPCAQDACESLSEIAALLPSGRLWELREGRNFTRFWCAVAEVMSRVRAGICQEWNEADPCQSVRTLERWAEIHCFPVHCVELTTEKMCEWIDFKAGCGAGTEGFILGLMDFIGFDYSRYNLQLSDGSGGTERSITFSGPFDLFEEEFCGCDTSPLDVIRNPCGRIFIPEIDCIARDYFPVGLAVNYVADCDENLIRHIRNT